MFKNIKILVIEDKPDDLVKIRGTIKSRLKSAPNITRSFPVEFVDFDFGLLSKENDIDSLIIESILNDDITCLMVDYLIDLPGGAYNGNDIFESIKNKAPFLPIYLLTQLATKCSEEDNVDLDKIYEKSTFFSDKLDSTEMVDRIIGNCVRYIEDVNKSEADFFNMDNEDGEAFDLKKYLKLETKLKNSIPNYVSNKVIEAFNDDYKNILDLINKIEEK